MPYTWSHPASVIPLHGRGLPWAELVAGAIAPDVPMGLMLPDRWQHGAHRNAAGILLADPVVAVLLAEGWRRIGAEPVLAVLPGSVGARLAPGEERPSPARRWLAAAVGTLIHVGLDGCTHHTPLVARTPVLCADVAGRPVYTWLQLAGSIAGMAGLARLPAGPRPAERAATRSEKARTVGSFVAAAAITTVVRTIDPPPDVRRESWPVRFGVAAAIGTVSAGLAGPYLAAIASAVTRRTTIRRTFGSEPRAGSARWVSPQPN